MVNSPQRRTPSPVVTRKAESLHLAYPPTPDGLAALEADADRAGGLSALAAIYGCSRQAASSLLKARRRAVDTAAA
jgi:hypothetical protein